MSALSDLNRGGLDSRGERILIAMGDLFAVAAETPAMRFLRENDAAIDAIRRERLAEQHQQQGG